MTDFKKYPHGKDLNPNPGIEFDGNYYENLDIVIALSKALVKKGVLLRSEILAEL